jgi:Transcriptional regulator, AbiEi antitoxin
MDSNLARVDEIASRQWSLVTREQLNDAEISNRSIARMLRTGALRRVGHRVYAALGSPRSWEQQAMAAVLAAGPGAVASHATAARLWDFAYLPEDALDVTVRASDTERPRRSSVHRTLILPAEDVAERSGMPCTSFERTLCDCTTVLSQFQLGRVLDDGLRRGVASLDALMQCAARLDSGPGRRLRLIQRLLGERDETFDPGGSASELEVLRVLKEAGVALPVQQYRVRAGRRTFVLDFAWPESRVFAEYYGLAVHSGPSAVASDRARLTALVAAGWRPLVFTETTTDREIVRSVQNLLTNAQSDWARRDGMGA